MSETTPRFGLPLLAAGQAQKEIDHNEAVTLLEALVQPVAQALGANVPPSLPQPGQSWIVGTDPRDAWAGEATAVATWTAGGWRFVRPCEGMCLWLAEQELWAQRIGASWIVGALAAASLSIGGVQVVGPRAAPIADPAGGPTIDASARSAISAILTALRGHGLISG